MSDKNFVTYESEIILNFLAIKDEEKDVVTQLSTKTYASDSCCPLTVQANQYSQMSKLRVVPRLKYESHLELIEELSKDGPKPNLDSYYDHFYQEGESNIMTQKDTKGNPVNFGDDIQLYHEATERYLKAIPVDRTNSDESNKDFLAFKLGFSKHPSRHTHFKFESLYNTNTVYESKRVTDLDKIYLSFKENNKIYH